MLREINKQHWSDWDSKGDAYSIEFKSRGFYLGARLRTENTKGRVTDF